MIEPGFSWSIALTGEGWRWALQERDGDLTLVSGTAPTRAIAAAMVVRAIARGMTSEPVRSLAA